MEDAGFTPASDAHRERSERGRNQLPLDTTCDVLDKFLTMTPLATCCCCPRAFRAHGRAAFRIG